MRWSKVPALRPPVGVLFEKRKMRQIGDSKLPALFVRRKVFEMRETLQPEHRSGFLHRGVLEQVHKQLQFLREQLLHSMRAGFLLAGQQMYASVDFHQPLPHQPRPEEMQLLRN